MRSAILLSIVGTLGIGLAGCGTNEMETRREATMAALSTYPGNARESETLKLAAVDDEQAKTLRIINFSTNPVPASTVWVNGRFTRQISPIGAQSSVVIRYSDLLEGGAGVLDLSKRPGEQIQRVEIQTGEGLFNILGPAKI